MSYNTKEKGYGIAKYFKRIEGGARGGLPKDPSRMFQLNRMEGTGLGEAGPTHNDNHNNTDSSRIIDNTNEDGSRKDEDTNVYAYGGMEGDRKGKRDARLGP